MANEFSINFFTLQIKKLLNFGTKNIHIVIYVLIVVLSLDTLLNQTGDLIGKPLKTFGGIVLFITLSIITMIGQIFVLQFVGKKSEEIRKKNGKIRLMHRFVSISQIYNNYHICVSYLRNNNKPELFADILNANDSDKLHAKYYPDGRIY